MDLQPKETSTKQGAGTQQIDLDTVSPTGHEEVITEIAHEQKGDAQVPAPPESKPPKAPSRGKLPALEPSDEPG